VTFVVATHDHDVITRSSATLRLEHGAVSRATATWGTKVGPATRDRGPGRGASGAQPRPTIPGGTKTVTSFAPRTVVLEVERVSKSYRRGPELVRAVRDASFTVAEGELVGLSGRSGSGKTTLLNVVAGWERADSGTVRLAGREVRVRTSPSWSELAVVPQRLGLIDELTIRENIEYPARLTSSLEEVQPLIDELIERLGLRELQHRYPSETSIGEQQRAAMARALVLSPGLVVADEPTGHQDRGWSNGVIAVLRRSVSSGSACLTATHSEELLRYLDRAFLMSDGRIAERSG
jgi:putative ABC transport system ATP-binding protein